MRPWSGIEPLERGVTLIEASAGTGKTFGITNLVVRLVAEAGVPIERILVVTYTRAATAELEDRTRSRLVLAIAALEGEAAPDDPVFALLHARGVEDPAVRAVQLRRLSRAVESFDLALISTIHGFCQRMLQQNAFESRVAFDLELAPDTDRLVEEIVDDVLVRTFYAAEPERVAFLRQRCGFTREGLLGLARKGLSDPDTQVIPAADGVDPAGWETILEDFQRRWPSLGDDVVAFIEGGGGGALKPKQRTYTAPKVRAWADAIGAWAGGSPRWFDPQPDVIAWLSPASSSAQLADPDVPMSHPAIDAVEQLGRFVDGVASCLRAAFVRDVRAAFEVAKARLRVQTYQDLLRGLASRLRPTADPADRAALAAAIGGAFDAALIDEFQDTDAEQWTLFSTCFGNGAHHLYLIGDPKQAIYGFRGANVHVYAEAARSAARRQFTMVTNWRSDERLLDALNTVMNREALFGPGASFNYLPVAPPTERLGRDGLSSPLPWTDSASSPLQLRWIDASLVGSDGSAPLGKTAVAAALPARVAEDVVELLSAGWTVPVGDAVRPLAPGDVAILVRKGIQATAVQAALTSVGVPSVLTGAMSVLASEEALAVQYWLEALTTSSGGAFTRVAASTALFGWTAERLLAIEAKEPLAVADWERWLGGLARWRERIGGAGFMRAFGSALDDEDVLSRLLALADGERRVTNLLHVAELLNAAETEERLGVGALLAWLKRRRGDEDLDADVAELRLDRDADAVKVLTMHKAKGLEFPVVFVPYLWDGALLRGADLPALLVSREAEPTLRVLDVHVDASCPPKSDNVARAAREAQEEGIRLAYVALTRARHRTVVYTGAIKDFGTSPLASVVHGSGPDRLTSGAVRAGAGPEGLLQDLLTLARESDRDGEPGVAVSIAGPLMGLTTSLPEATPPTLDVRRFGRGPLDPHWRRHSYTSVVRAAGHAGSEVIESRLEGFDDDGLADEFYGGGRRALAEAEVPLAVFPGGADAGTLLHAVFEGLDFELAHPRVPSDEATVGVSAVVSDALSAHGFAAARWTEPLTLGFLDVLRTPLGGPLTELRLCDVPRSARLDELRFDLPLAGGSAHARQGEFEEPVRGTDLALALRLASPGTLPSDWLASLERLEGLYLAGFLTGSIDLVFHAGEGERRWFVVDYKSNKLHTRGACVSSAFGQDGMLAELTRHDYFLQYHLYLVALHRFLRWRLGAAYDYDRDVGGVYYLFFRGMLGAGSPRDGDLVRGSFFDRPTKEVIEALDRAFVGAPTPARVA